MGTYESQGFVVVGTFLRSISVVPRVSFACLITRVVWLGFFDVLEQNALTMKWLHLFWNAHVDPVSAIRNVKVHVSYEPFMFIDYIVNQVQYESVRQRFD